MAPADPQITLTVKSTSGTWADARFNRSNKGQRILDDGVKHFHLEPNPAVPYVLTHTGRVLSLGEKIQDLGLEKGDVVHIQAGQPVDG
jgi:hypothetical protein